MSDSSQGTPPPAGQLMQIVFGQWVAAAVHTAVRLKLPDQFAGGVVRSTSDLAEAVGAHSESVFRLLRALASVGLFRESDPRQFALTEMGELLCADHPESLRDMFLFQGSQAHWNSWGQFDHSIRTGDSTFEHVHGMGLFDYCATNKEFSDAFNGAMTGFSAPAADAIIDAYDFSGITHLVDVGGGHGLLITAILERYPQLQGTVFDLSHVVAGAQQTIDAKGVGDRCDIVGGSFFESIPAADAYIAKNIIHDWSDDESVTILRNMRAGLAEGGRVLLAEAIIPTGNDPYVGKLLDLEMLHSTHGGRERDKEQFAALFSQAGLKLSRIILTKAYFSVIEAVAV